MQGPPDEQLPDFSGTDTLPLPILRVDDTGRFDGPALDEEEVPVRIRPRVRVQDPLTSTDTFQARSLEPLPVAMPVDTSDLAESLREHEQELEVARATLLDREEELVRLRQQYAELESRLAASEQRCSELQSRLEEAERRCQALQAGRDAVPAEAAAAGEEPQGAGQQPSAQQVDAPVPIARASAAAGEPAAQRELEAIRRENQRLHEALSTVHARIGVHEAMLFEAEEALRAARQAPVQPGAAAPAEAPRPDSAAVDWQSRCTELEGMLEAERAAWAGVQREHQRRLEELQAELEAARNGASGAPAGQKPLRIGTVLRVLVREEDGTEFVYPLGRHTTIGRTPDNDIQVNTTFVSRHHAVLLTSSQHCIVEDLNSTNGIMVNGQRVDRALLHDGDVLTVGRTNFRYETRQ